MVTQKRKRKFSFNSGHDSNRLSLWPIGAALTACFLVAILGLAGLTLLALALLHFPRIAHPGAISLHDGVSVLQLVFATVAGAGALVALVMAYRRQRVAETTAAHDRMRMLNERFIASTAQIGDNQPAIRLAGVHAMAGLADDWEENRQTCIDVLCAYLRMPYEANPHKTASADTRLSFQREREVRHTVIRVISAHLRDDAKIHWRGMDLDFTGVVFDGGDFSGAHFSDGVISFREAEFSGDGMNFLDTTFEAEGSPDDGFDGVVSFVRARFLAGMSTFARAKFAGFILFGGAQFSGGHVFLGDAKYAKGKVSFSGAEFSGAEVDFEGAEFSGAQIDFDEAKFSDGKVDFSKAYFTGGKISFEKAADWSHPPTFGKVSLPPDVVLLPAVPNGGQASGAP